MAERKHRLTAPWFALDRVTYVQVAAAPSVEDSAEAGRRAAAQAGQCGAVPLGHARATAVQQWLRSTKVPHAAPDICAHAACSSCAARLQHRHSRTDGRRRQRLTVQQCAPQVAGDALLLALFASCDLVVWAQPRSAPDPALLHKLRSLQVAPQMNFEIRLRASGAWVYKLISTQHAGCHAGTRHLRLCDSLLFHLHLLRI